MNTNKEIISIAKQSIKMVYNGRNQYHIDTWSESHNAWWQDNTNRPYCFSLVALRESYIQFVIDYVFQNKPQCLFNANHVDGYQDWRQFARHIINTARKEQVGTFSENN